MSEAARAVEISRSTSAQTRAYDLMRQQERETLESVQIAGGNTSFLLAPNNDDDEFLPPTQQRRTVFSGRDGTITINYYSGDSPAPIVPVTIIDSRTQSVLESVERRWGIQFADPEQWSWSNILAVNTSFRQTEYAVRQTYPLAYSMNMPGGMMPAENVASIKNFFEGVTLHIGSDGNPIAYLAFNVGNAGAIVPPPGLGGDGRTIYFNDVFANGATISPDLINHEMGHVIDFQLGSSFTLNTLYDIDNPSTDFLVVTGGQYDYNTVARWMDLWGVAVGVRDSGYLPGGSPPAYSSSYPIPPDHFEDFASSWEEWVRWRNGGNPINMDSSRYNFFDRNIANYLYYWEPTK
jgi:hypothetical protein